MSEKFELTGPKKEKEINHPDQKMSIREYYYTSDYECLGDIMDAPSLILIRKNKEVYYIGKNDPVPEGFHEVTDIKELSGQDIDCN